MATVRKSDARALKAPCSPALPEQADVAVIGGGCAGLSIARRLSDAGGIRHGLVLEASEQPRQPHQRWCFWQPPGEEVIPDPLVSARWTKTEVCWKGKVIATDHPDWAYCQVRATDYRDWHLRELSSNGAFSYHPSCGVATVQLHPAGGHAIETPKGPTVVRKVVDASGWSGQRLKGRGWVQSFLGREIFRSSAPFEPTTVRLMDFVDGSGFPLAFGYVLPYSATHAFVEIAVVDTRRHSKEALEPLLQSYVRQAFGGDARGEAEESGAIPMERFLGAPDLGESVLNAGTRGGAVRLSSGYAFLAIQRQARALAGHLVDGDPLARPRRRYDWLDRLFLEMLADDPAAMPGHFLQLFERTPPEALFSFLTEGGDLVSDLKAIHSLPKLPFLRRLLTRWKRLGTAVER